MATKNACPEGCGQEIDPRGLAAHLRHSRAHGGGGGAFRQSPASPGDSPANSQEAVLGNSSEGCSSCSRLSQEIEELRSAAAAPFPETAATPPAAASESLANRPVEIPDLSTVLAHCETGDCSPHAQQLQRFKEAVLSSGIEALSDDAVREMAMQRGVIPGRFVLRGIGA